MNNTTIPSQLQTLINYKIDKGYMFPVTYTSVTIHLKKII